MQEYQCQWSAAIIAYDDHIEVKPYCCRCWTCDACQHLRLRQLYALVLSGEPTKWITLTSQVREGITPDIAAQNLVRAWRLIRQRAKRAGIAEHIPFIAIFEETKQGWPHLHIPCRAPYIPQAWLSKQMEQIDGSPIVDIRSVTRRKQLAKYLAKYVSKGPETYIGCKRYWRSKDWTLQKPDTPLFDRSGYTKAWISSFSITYTLEELQYNGWNTTENDNGTYTAWPAPGATNPYPDHDETNPANLKAYTAPATGPPAKASTELEEIHIPGWPD